MKKIQELPLVTSEPGNMDALVIDSASDAGTRKITYNTLKNYIFGEFISTPRYELDTTAQAGTLDGDLYYSIKALSLESEIID